MPETDKGQANRSGEYGSVEDMTRKTSEKLKESISRFHPNLKKSPGKEEPKTSGNRAGDK